MAGLASPDIPAVFTYGIVLVVGLLVARGYVNERLKDYPDHWAFPSTWLLLVAYWAVPVALFWLLDYTGAVHDTSLIAALLVAFGYRQIFSGGLQGVTVAGQASAFWKPFQTWTENVAARIHERQARYITRFAEHLRNDFTRNSTKLDLLQTLALQRTRDLGALRTAIVGVQAIPEAEVKQSRLFDVLWPDLKGSAPGEYGYLLHKQGLVSFGRRWWWLERGRAKTASGLSLLAGFALVGVLVWSASDPRGATFLESATRRYYQWRFLKVSATERDRWRSREYFSRELREAAALGVPPLAQAQDRAQEAANEAQRTRDALAAAKSAEEKAQATATLNKKEAEVELANRVEKLARHTAALVRPLIDELRYAEIPSRQVDDILRLVVDHHSPGLDTYYLPDLIETIRTSNEVVRLNVHKTVLALQKADFPKPPLEPELADWEPRKNDTAERIDGFVRRWRAWWQSVYLKLRP